MTDGDDLEAKIFSVFSELAGTLGYSPIHGKIIGALLVEGEPLSLQRLADKTGYSAGMISLSLDLLELLGVIKKIKKPGDRKLYVKLEGDLLEVLKNAVVIKVKKGIDGSLSDLREKRAEVQGMKGPEKRNFEKTLDTLEKEIRRLEKYVNLLSGIRLP
jgi:DNA-binding transcriptional regulator GbsR (MarR family)